MAYLGTKKIPQYELQNGILIPKKKKKKPMKWFINEEKKTDTI